MAEEGLSAQFHLRLAARLLPCSDTLYQGHGEPTIHAVAFLGDCLAQKIEGQTPWNLERSMIVCGWGLSMGGAPVYYWFRFLERTWPNAGAQQLWKPVLKKVFTNQLISSPIMNTLFYGYLQFFSHHNTHLPWTERWLKKLEDDLLHTQVKSLVIWTPLNLVNFYYVPAEFRVVYISVGLVGWFALLSFIGHKRQVEGDKIDK